MSVRKNETMEMSAVSDSGYSYEQLKPLVQATLEAGISVLVLGHPGIGKSTLAKELAKNMNRELIDIRLAQKDPAELGGVYFPNREAHTLELLPPEWVIRAQEVPCFIFLDEINAAVTKLHQAAAYQIVLEKCVGSYSFHRDTVVMAAGNLEDDNAIVTPLSSALCNRFAHYEMRPDAGSWLEWAAGNGINEHIMAFIQTYGKEVLYKAESENAFPSPRSWEMASRIMDRVESEQYKRVVCSCIGTPMADRFIKYLNLYRKVNAEKIIEGKITMDFNKERDPSLVYAAIFAVAGYLVNFKMSDEQLGNVVRFLNFPGVEPEYQILFLKHLKSRSRGLLDRLKALPEFRKLAGNLVSLRTTLYTQ